MPKRVTAPPLLLAPLDAASGAPLHRQLYAALRAAILARQLVPGVRLPSTRALAAELRIARSTVVSAYEQLQAEGYIEGRIGAGTRVAHALPDDAPRRSVMGAISPTSPTRTLSQRGASLLAVAGASDLGLASGLFHPGLPVLDAFPTAIRGAAGLAAAARGVGGDARLRRPRRVSPLREAIAAYLNGARAARCTPEQVIVLGGTQQAIDLVARLLLDPGATAWVEEPGYIGARGALLAACVRLVPVPVDGDGLDVATGIARAPEARLAYVTPSHQFPLGPTLGLARRLELLAWADRAGAWIVEDDYDSEYRFAGRPLAALQGLDTAGRVIYLGTFSKVLAPALRLGYLVVPPDLIEAFVAVRALTDRHTPTLDQAVLADFIVEGHFARHLRRVRDLAAERQAALVSAAHDYLAGLVEVTPQLAGLHLVGRLPAGGSDRIAARRAAAAGIVVPPLSACYLGPAPQHGLLLGYASATPAALRDGVRTLAAALT